MIAYLILALIYYIFAVALIAGMIFAMLHRDGQTDPMEWRRDLKSAVWLGIVLGSIPAIGILLGWMLADCGKRGWTLWPDKTQPLEA